MPISDRLNELANRAKKTELVIDAARSKDRKKLAQQRDELTRSIDASRAKITAQGDHLVRSAQGTWGGARSSVDAHLLELRANAEQRKVERTTHKAKHHAEAAEENAAEALDFALYALVEAQFAIFDAVVARADADDLLAHAG